MSNRVPEGWRATELGESSFVTKLAGYEYTKHFDYSLGGEIVAIRALNLKKGRLDLTDVQTIPKSVSDELPRSKLSKNDLVVSYVGTVGEVALIDQNDKYHLAPNVAKVSPKLDLLIADFLLQVMTSDETQNSIKLLGSVTSQPSLSMGNLRKVSVLLPPLPEQQKIATILSSVDDVIEKTRAQIDKLKGLKTGMMQELLTKGIGHTEFKDSPVGRIPASWSVKTIGDLGKVVTGNTPKTVDPSNYNGRIPFISPSDIGDAIYIKTAKSSITEKGLTETRELPKGSVSVVCIGSTIGKTGITTRRCATNQQINSVICENTHPEFVYYLLTHYSKIIKAEAGTQAVPIINKSSFSALQVQCPEYNEQIKIGNAISSVDKNIIALVEKLKLVESTKKALMQDLLTGKVRVNLTDKESAAS